MNKRLLPLILIPALTACAPTVMTSAPVRVNNSASYTNGIIAANVDNPVLAAIVSIAPTAPVTGKNYQSWRAEEIERNSVVLRSHPTSINPSVFSLSNYPQEMSWNVISSGGTTTVSATYSSAYAAAAQYIFDQLDKKFSRVR